MLLPRLVVTLLMGLSFLVAAQTPASANGSTGTIGSSCATKYGRLFCWGYNKDSQLGLGDTANRSRPTRVGGATNWRMVDAGWSSTCGIRAGKLYCWGVNTSGQVGVGDLLPHRRPTRVGGAADWTTVSVGEYTACGLRSVKLWCWGSDSSGGVGVGGKSFTPYVVPQAIRPDLSWIHISVERYHTCGVTSTNDLYCWGNQPQGQFGNGTTVGSDVPLMIGAEKWLSVSRGALNALTCDRARVRGCSLPVGESSLARPTDHRGQRDHESLDRGRVWWVLSGGCSGIAFQTPAHCSGVRSRGNARVSMPLCLKSCLACPGSRRPAFAMMRSRVPPRPVNTARTNCSYRLRCEPGTRGWLRLLIWMMPPSTLGRGRKPQEGTRPWRSKVNQGAVCAVSMVEPPIPQRLRATSH